MLIGVFVANIVLIDTLGWVISGGLLFYGSALALGSRHFIRDVFIAAALSLGHLLRLRHRPGRQPARRHLAGIL